MHFIARLREQWDAANAAQAVAVAEVREKQAEETVEVVTQYVDRVRIVRAKADTIIKEVPVYVTAEADAACAVNRGFVRLHDSAAAGDGLPGTPELADAAPAAVALSAVAGTVAANYSRCHENAEQLMALQDWARRVKAPLPH